MIASEVEARAFVAARCDGRAMDRLERFSAALAGENQRQNLVAAGSFATLWQRHIADSAQLLDHVPATTTGPWLDLGSGAGFPGLIVAAMHPERDVVLVESRRMRIEWLQTMLAELALRKCRVGGSRLELIPSVPAGIISARAFASLTKTVTLARRFSTSDTLWLLPKGRSAAQEVEQLPPELRPMFHVEQSATDHDAGIVIGCGIGARKTDAR